MFGENKKQLFVPRNFVETLKELQLDAVLESDEDRAVRLLREAVRLAAGHDKENLVIAGTRDVLIHALSAFTMRQFAGDYQVVSPMDELMLRGKIAAVGLVQFNGKAPTIVVDIAGAVIKEPVPVSPRKGMIDGMLRVPVASVVSIWPAV